MPLRYGFYGSGAQRGAEGLFSGLEAAAEPMLQLSQRKMQADVESRRQLVKELGDKVMAGMDPDQAESAAQAFGAQVPPGFFHQLQPSVANRMQTALSGVTKAHTAADVPTVPDVNLGLTASHLNPMAGPGSPFTDPGSFDETNPDAASVYSAKQQALLNAEPSREIGKTDTPSFPDSNVPPDIMAQGGMQPEGETDFTPTTIMGKQNPFTGQMMETGRQPSGSSAITAGRVRGVEARAAAPDEGSAQAQIEDLMRGPKAATAQAVSGANERGRVLASAEPDVLAAAEKVRFGTEYAAAKATQKAEQDGFNITPGLVTTSLGNKYIDLDAFVGKDQQWAARYAGDAGLTVVKGPQASMLRSIDDARQKLQHLGQLADRLSSSSFDTLRGLKGASLVKINQALQRDPALAEFNAAAVDGAGLMRAVSDMPGIRVNRLEYENTVKNITPFSNGWLADNKEFYQSKLNYLLRSLFDNELVNVKNDRQQAFQQK